MLKRRLVVGDAIAACARPGQEPSWLLIPGGPGMGCEYLVELFSQINLKGAVWSFELSNPCGPVRPDAAIVEGWKASLRIVLERLGPAIVFGHSFGGMLALSTEGLDELCLGLILMSSSPDRGWETQVKNASRVLQSTEEKVRRVSFERQPSTQTLRELFTTWTSYYFTKEGRSRGRELLLRNSYFDEVYRIGQRRFYPDYAARRTLPRIPTFCLAGECDVVTPLSLFQNKTAWRRGKFVEYFPINRGGHFPWVENFVQVANTLQVIEGKVARRKL